MPPLPRNRIGADDDATVDDQPAARAGAQDHAEDDRLSGGSTVTGFGEREAVRVIGDSDRALETPLEVVT